MDFCDNMYVNFVNYLYIHEYVMLDNSAYALIQWQKPLYWARSLVQHVDPSDHGKDINLCYV